MERSDDVIDGGAPGLRRDQRDEVDYTGAPGAVTVNLAAGTAVGDGTDRLDGLPGDDELEGSPGDDTFLGGDGLDVLQFNTSHVAVSVNLAAGSATGQGNDAISGVENLAGSIHGDLLVGDEGPNAINGNLGNDVISGAGGDDHLRGIRGNDTINGVPATTPSRRSRVTITSTVVRVMTTRSAPSVPTPSTAATVWTPPTTPTASGRCWWTCGEASPRGSDRTPSWRSRTSSARSMQTTCVATPGRTRCSAPAATT